MDRSSRTSGSGWGGTGAGSFSVNAPQADSRQRPGSNSAGGTLMDLVASSSRARPQQPTASLPPRTAAPPSQSPFATSPWDHGSGAESISPGVMPQAPSGSWRASVGGGDLMSVLAESARRSEQGQFYPASPGTWRDHLGGDDLMSVVAESTRRTEQPQFYAAGTVSSPGYGLDASAWPPVAEAGGSREAQPVLPSATPATWRESLGGGDLMSVLAESARHAEQPQFYAAGTVSSPGYGLDAGAWPPVAEAGGSSVAQPVLPSATPATWRESLGGGDLMSVVAESARRTEQPPIHPSGDTTSAMAGGWGGSARQSMISFGSPAAAPAEAASASHSRSKQPNWSGRISQEEFDKISSLVNSGSTVNDALKSIGRQDLHKATVRGWLASAGVRSHHGQGRPSAFSAAQIQSALRAQANYIQQNGTLRSSVRAAYESLGPNAGSWSAFKTYFKPDGLSEHGRAKLIQALALEPRVAHNDGSGPSS